MRIISMSQIVLLGLLLTACEFGQQDSQKEAPPVPVLAAAPSVKDVPVYVEAIGLLHPAVLIEIRPQVSGMLAQVLVDEGQWVAAGTPLFKIDSRMYATKVQEAEAQLTMDSAAWQTVQKKLARFRSLAQKDLIAQSDWDDLEIQAVKAQAVIKMDEARLDAAKLDFDNCTLASPAAARVGKIDVYPGLLVSNGQPLPLVILSDMDPLMVEFNVTEKEFASLPQQVQEIDVQPICASGVCTAGKLTFIDNRFDGKTGQLLIRGEIPNPQSSLRAGQSVRVRIPVSVVINAKLIPQKAVRYNQAGPYAYIVKADNTVALRQLLLGDDLGNDVIVLEGLDSSELVITDGHLRLYPGLKVEVKS